MKKIFCFATGLMVLALHPLCADGMNPAEEALLAGKEVWPPPPATLPGETDETQDPVGPPSTPEESTSPDQQIPPDGSETAPQSPSVMQKKSS
jgi:hypothetical protein